MNQEVPKHWLDWTESSKEMMSKVVSYNLLFLESGCGDVLTAFVAVWSNIFLRVPVLLRGGVLESPTDEPEWLDPRLFWVMLPSPLL